MLVWWFVCYALSRVPTGPFYAVSCYMSRWAKTVLYTMNCASLLRKTHQCECYFNCRQADKIRTLKIIVFPPNLSSVYRMFLNFIVSLHWTDIWNQKNSAIILKGLFSDKIIVLEMGEFAQNYLLLRRQTRYPLRHWTVVIPIKKFMGLLQVFVIKFRQSFYSYNPSLPSAWPLLGDRQMLTGPSRQSFFVLPFEIPTPWQANSQHLSKKSLTFSKRFLF